MTSNKNNTICTTATTGGNNNNNSNNDNNEHNNINDNNITTIAATTNNELINNDIADGNATTSTAPISSNLNNVVAAVDCKNINNDADKEPEAGMATGSIEAEYKKIQERTGWHRLYQEIREKSEREATVKNYSTKESEKPKNRGLNRYRDVNPYDHSRIILHRGNVDYINANLVKVKRAGRQYILTQGPLADTVGHFWLMVWEQNSRAILMLNKIIEKKQIKCHKYWPDHVDRPLQFPELKLTVEFVRSETYKNFLCRWFKLSDQESKESRNIIQFHYTTWPDFGIPSSPVTFLQFLKQVRKSGTLEPNVGPAVVHCSAGIGRSGTFCLVDCCLVLFEKEGEHKVSVQDVLFEMRRYRMGLIQTADQLYFSYQAIIEGIKLLKDPDFLNFDETPTIVNSTEDESSRNMMENLLDNNEHRLRAGHYEVDELPPPLPPRTLSSVLPQALTSGLFKMNDFISSNNGGDDDNNHLPIINNKTDELNNMIDNGMFTQRPLPPLPPLPPVGHHHNHHQRRQQDSLERVHESDSEENDEFMDDDYDSDNSMSDDDNADIAINDNDDNYVNIMDNNDNDDDDDDTSYMANVDNNLQLFKKNINYQSAQEQKLLLLQQQIEDGNHLNANTTTKTTNANDHKIISLTENTLNDLLSNTTKTMTTNQIPPAVATAAVAAEPASDDIQRELRRRKRAERRNNLEDIVKEIKRMQRESDVEAAKKGSRFAFIKRLGRGPLVAYLTAGVFVGAICVYAYTKMG